jgi:hypothetical protein
MKDLNTSIGQVQGPGDYYHENILKKHVLNDQRLKND